MGPLTAAAPGGCPCQEAGTRTVLGGAGASAASSAACLQSLCGEGQARLPSPCGPQAAGRPRLQASVWGRALSSSPAVTGAQTGLGFPCLRTQGSHQWSRRHLTSVNPVVQSWASDVILRDGPALWCRPLAQTLACSWSHPGRPSARSGEQPHPCSREGFQLRGRELYGTPHDSAARGWNSRQLLAQAVSISHIHRSVPLLFPIHREIPYAYSFNVELMD